jgi:hypothetical protein
MAPSNECLMRFIADSIRDGEQQRKARDRAHTPVVGTAQRTQPQPKQNQELADVSQFANQIIIYARRWWVWLMGKIKDETHPHDKHHPIQPIPQRALFNL